MTERENAGRRVNLHVEGMTCGSCVARVENSLRATEGVLDASVNLATASAEVAVGQDVTESALVDALRRAGYGGGVNGAAGADQLTPAVQKGETQLKRQRRAFAWSAAGWLALMLVMWVAPHTMPWMAVQGVICTLLLVAVSGRTIISSGLRAMRHLAPNMDTLVTLGVGAAYLSSVVVLIAGQLHPLYFEAVAMILLFINGGKYIETRAKREAGRAVATLAGRIPRFATCFRDGEWREIPADELRRGDRVRVVQDQAIPVDGRVLEGSAAVDESMITGEPMPRTRKETADVFGGAIVREGTIIVEARRVGGDTAIGRIVKAVEQAQSGKTALQRLADRVAGFFVPIVIVCAVVTAALWLAAFGLGWAQAPQSQFGWALRCAIAVLVIACPCAMGLATPVAVLVSTGRAAQSGILVRSPAALEAAGRADVVVFDKTGTLTTGSPVVDEVYDEPVGPVSIDSRDLLKAAASAEQFSQHPLGKAIVNKAREWSLQLVESASFSSKAGRGVQANIDGREVLVGSLGFLRENGVDVTPVEDRGRQFGAAGRTVVGVAINGSIAGLIGLRDAIREHAPRVIEDLESAGYRVAMITGDGSRTAQAVAAEVGIGQVSAQMLPEAKMAEVQRLRESGRIVVFVGDGTNDAPALAAADAGVAFAAGTDIANQAADMTLVGSDLRTMVTALSLAKRSVRIIKENLFWAFFYNVVMIPLAALGKIPPGWAAGAMMLSSISVVLNSLRLRRV